MAPLEVAPDDITLITSLEDPSVDIEAVLLTWEDLHPYSVDTITMQRSELFDFAASDECMMFASVQLKVTEQMPSKGKDGSGTGSAEQTGDLQQVDWVEDTSSTWDVTDPAVATTSANEPCDVRTVTTVHTVGVFYLRKTEMFTEYNIGLSIHPEWRGQGLAGHILAKGMAYAFTELWAHRVQALIMDGPSSDAARSIFTSLGFTFEGIRRRAIMSPAVDGGYRDITTMAMLDTEWHVRAHGGHGPRSVWDEMFVRHHKEREDLLQWEERRKRLRRTGSMETVREGPVELALTSGAPSPTASSVDLSDHAPALPDLRLSTPDPTSDIEGTPSVPPSPCSSTASWSDLDASSQPSSPLSKDRRKRKGKGRAAQRPPRGPSHDNGYTSGASASSGWDVV